MSMVEDMTELPDRWILPLRHHRVVGITWDENVIVELEPSSRIVLGYGALYTPVSVRAHKADDSATVGRRDRAEVEQLVGCEVLSPVGFKNGALRIVFDNGWKIDVRAETEFVPAAVISGDMALWIRSDGPAAVRGDHTTADPHAGGSDHGNGVARQ